VPLLLKLILTPVVRGCCSKCGCLAPCVRLDLFLSTAETGATDPLCYNCLNTGELNLGIVELKEVDGVVLPSKRPALRRQRRLSQKQEAEIADALGARVQPASGALPGSKGDGRRKDVLRFEAKFTQAQSFVVRLDELHKIASECHGRERPVLVLDFKEKDTGKLRDRFAVVRFEDVKEMFNASSHHR